MLYFLIFMFAYLFVVLIILIAIDSLTNNYPKHAEDKSFLSHVYVRDQACHKSVDGFQEAARVRY